MASVTVRRVLALALVGLVLALSGGSTASASTSAAAVSDQVPAAVTVAAAPVTTAADHVGERGSTAPCVLRAECGGGWALGGAAAGLLLAVVVAAPSIGGRVLVTPLLGLLRSLVSRLVDGRLFHPPQFA